MVQDDAFGVQVQVDIPEWLRRNQYKLVTTIEELDEVAAAIKATDGPIALDLETSGLDLWTDFIAGVCVAWGEAKACYIPVAHVAGPNCDTEAVKQFLAGLTHREIVYHGAVFDVPRLRKWWGLDFKYENYHDTMSYVFRLDANFSAGLKQNVERYLGYKPLSLEDIFKGATPQFHKLPVDLARWYAAADADNTLRLFNYLYPRVRNDFKLPIQIDRAIIPICAAFKEEGVHVKVKYLQACQLQYDKLAKEAESQINDIAGWTVRVTSNADVAKLLFDQLKLPILGYTPGSGKTDAKGRTKPMTPQTTKKVMDQLRNLHPVVALILNVKSFVKQRGYCGTLMAYIKTHDEKLMEEHGLGVIHANYLMFHVPTNRFACADPNLQQIPHKKSDPGWEKAPSIRSAFRPYPGYIFLEADYSQVELRVAAALSKSKAYMDAFANGHDIHSATMAAMKHKPIEDISRDERQKGKTINFGLWYGMNASGLAQRLNISDEEAGSLYEEYFRAIPESKIWMEKVVQKARAEGGVRTHFGHWRSLPEIKSKIRSERAFGERSAVNTIVQGTAADILKLGKIRCWRMLSENYNHQAPYPERRVRMVFSTHDSILFEVREDVDLNEFVSRVKEAMELKIDGFPELLIECKMGNDYGNLHGLDGGEVEVEEEDEDAVVSFEESPVAVPTSAVATDLKVVQNGSLHYEFYGTLDKEFAESLRVVLAATVKEDGRPLKLRLNGEDRELNGKFDPDSLDKALVGLGMRQVVHVEASSLKLSQVHFR